MQGTDVTFQTWAAVIGKARSPTVETVYDGRSADDDDAERRRPRASRSEDRRNSSDCGGVVGLQNVTQVFSCRIRQRAKLCGAC